MNLRTIIRNVDTDEQMILVQLNKEQIAQVRKTWNIPEGEKIQFLHSEIYAQGGGWYAIMAKHGFARGAQRGLANIQYSLFGYEVRQIKHNRAEQEKRRILNTPIHVVGAKRKVLKPEASWKETLKPVPVSPQVVLNALKDHFSSVHIHR